MGTPQWRKEHHEQMKAYRRKWYANHKVKAKKSIYQRRRDLRIWLQEYKSKLQCIQCGENHPACLDFHHKDINEKELEVSLVIGKGWSKKRILAEIEKCEILCANCHRKLHYESRRD